MIPVLTTEKYNELYEKYHVLLKLISRQYPSVDKDDVNSIIGTSIWRSFQNYNESKGPYVTYLSVCFKNELSQLKNRQNSQKRKANVIIFSYQEYDSSDDIDTVNKNHISYLPRQNNKDVSRIIENLPLEILNKNERKVIQLYLKGFKLKDMAIKLKKTYKNVHSATESMSKIFREACQKLKLGMKK